MYGCQRELHRLEEERLAHDSVWLQYVVQLSELFAKQAQERDAYLSQIATATTQWAQRAKAASAALATITAEGDPAAQDTEEDQAAADAAAQAAEDRRQRCAAHTQAMLEAFQKAREQAEGQAVREHSRTPRKKRPADGAPGDLSESEGDKRMQEVRTTKPPPS